MAGGRGRKSTENIDLLIECLLFETQCKRNSVLFNTNNPIKMMVINPICLKTNFRKAELNFPMSHSL